ncbi:MAG TPA: glycosyltransferase family 39 protein [Planctomycetia bacterium]|nr:glycosyltransferase family 39 protein [Planctomycetia bacterium]
MNPQRTDEGRRLTGGQRLLLFATGAVAMGIALVGGRDLTMHESVLSQSSREMLAANEWLTPTSGGRPWLERPPLPQWIVMLTGKIAGGLESEAAVRFGSVAAGMLAAFLTAGIGARLFGATVGLVAGLMLATALEFTRYSWLAEQDIYLACLVTLSFYWLVRSEFGPQVGATPTGIFAPRPWPYFAFFVSLALTHLVKGLLFGPAMVGIPLVLWLLWEWNAARWRRLVWAPGVAACLLIAAAWPAAAYFAHPGIADLWRIDLLGRVHGTYAAINEPWWYYWVALPACLAPWTPLAFFGLWASRRKLRTPGGAGLRLLWCWAIALPVALGLARGKHHHYLLHCMPAWMLLASWTLVRLCSALGAVRTQWSWNHPAGRLRRLAYGGLAAITAAYAGGYVFQARFKDRGRFDVAFLKSVPERTPADRPLVCCVDDGSLDFFRTLFYLRRAELLHNLTFLREARFAAASEVYVVTLGRHEKALKDFGEVETLDRSEKSRWEKGEAERLTLFRLRFHPAVARTADRPYITPAQAMYRAEGPFLR